MTDDIPLRNWILGKWHRLTGVWATMFRVERGPYGNVIVRFGKQSYSQRSGHGAICDLRIGRFVMWADPRTGRPFSLFRTRNGG